MAPTTATNLPATVTAGDSFAVSFTDSRYPTADGWAPSLTLINAAGRITVVGAVVDAAYSISADAATTAAWAPGRYRLAISLTLGANRATVAAQDVEILPDPAGAALFDPRTFARKTLDALEAWIESKDMAVASYRIADREMRHIPIGELLELRSRLQAEARREDAAASGRRMTKLQVRF